ncbi:MAG TPA: hypothetical protein VFC16_14565 [Nakamurella sp.]|nr:hypothetical protein [Nakamurella sp.]
MIDPAMRAACPAYKGARVLVATTTGLLAQHGSVEAVLKLCSLTPLPDQSTARPVSRTTTNDQHSDKPVTPMAVAAGREPVLAFTVGGTTWAVDDGACTARSSIALREACA